MELKLDKTKTYAIALEGGGARGGYEVGAWKALEEAGIRYNAVAGTSVGALNGAMMTMRELDKAIELWENVSLSQVVEVDKDMESVFEKLFSGDFVGIGIKNLAEGIFNVFRDGGLDITPLRQMVDEVVDEKKIRASDVNFYIKTFSLSDMKALDIDVKLLPEGQIGDMLIASAYLPAFKNEKLGGKRYTDGGIEDIVPVESLVKRGYKDIIAVRVFGFGREKRVKLRQDMTLTTIEPNIKLGFSLNFNSELTKRNMNLGYYDAKRVLYGLYGEHYYIDRSWTEEEAHRILAKISGFGKELSLREINESLLPRLARKYGARSDYYDLIVRFMESMAAELGLPEMRIYKDEELLGEIKKACLGKVKRPHSELSRLIKFCVSEQGGKS